MSEINKQANEYRELHKPASSRVSKLDRFTELVLNFHRDKYSYKQISEFLESVGLSVSKETIGRFIKKHTLDNEVKEKGRSEHKITSPDIENDSIESRALNPLSNIPEPTKKNFIFKPKN
ncbi:TPA: hypothetical protein ACPY9J_003755 [Yersinia enterocolitica]